MYVDKGRENAMGFIYSISVYSFMNFSSQN